VGAESKQKWLDRNRPPRVQIKYEVQTGGALEQVELPFLVGVMADLSGQPLKPLDPLKKRQFTNIDRDNFNDVLQRAAPRLAFGVDNKLTAEGGKLNVELKFAHMDDFSPAAVARQVAPLRELLEARDKLKQLLGRMEGNDQLVDKLTEILSNTETAVAAAKAAGVPVPAGEGTANG
jgi:type VI secretion system protein ImpB